jgi:hypothetical protein
MSKSILSVYIDTEVKNLINKEVAEKNLANVEGKRVKVSNILEQIITEHYLRKQSDQTVVL